MTQENTTTVNTNSGLNSPSNLEFALKAAELAANTRCTNVVVLDLRGRSPVTEFFVIATGSSARQMRTVADELEDLGKRINFKAWQKSGYDTAQWILIDFVHVVCHMFDEASRGFYDLEMLWGDAPRIDWRAELGLPPQEELPPHELTRDETAIADVTLGGWEDAPEAAPQPDAGHDEYVVDVTPATLQKRKPVKAKTVKQAVAKKPIKKAAAKKVVAKKPLAKKSVAKKPTKKAAVKAKPAKKVTKKPAAKAKAKPAKKIAAKKPVAKKSSPKKPTTKKPAAKKVIAKRPLKKIGKKK